MPPTPPTPRTDRLLILGSTARAAAGSARRAGWVPVCGDMFGDEDLRAMAETHVVADYPRGLLEVAAAIPPSRWLYTGALENSPRLIARISRRHQLLGNPPAVLKRVRDPFRVAELLSGAGLPALRVCEVPPVGPDGPSGPTHGAGEVEWLIKPRRGGGGRGIRVWGEGGRRKAESGKRKPEAGRRKRATRTLQASGSLPNAHSPLTTHHSPAYLQEFAAGTPISAVYLASRLSCRLAGVTRQLVGEEELHAPPFAYCGSLGPLRMPDELTQQIERIGRVLASECDLRGLFGVDCILRDGVVLPVEVNPRYTASVEVLELAAGRPLLGWHVRACESFADRESAVVVESDFARDWALWTQCIADSPMFGKAVLFAPVDSADVRVPPLEGVLPPVDLRGMTTPAIADVPRAGSFVRRSHPVCTVFAAAGTVAECLNALFGRVGTLWGALYESRTGTGPFFGGES